MHTFIAWRNKSELAFSTRERGFDFVSFLSGANFLEWKSAKGTKIFKNQSRLEISKLHGNS